MSVRNSVEYGKQRPALMFKPRAGVKQLQVTLEREGARAQVLKIGRTKAGKAVALEFDQPEGSFTYQATVKGKWAKGGDIGFVFGFEATSLSPLNILLEKKDVDVDHQRLTMALSRPAERVEYRVTGDGGRELDKGRMAVAGRAKERFELRWRAGDAVVEKISIRAYDRHGFWAGMDVTPFTVFIPHEEVEFESGQHEVRPSEAGKLEATLGELREALAKHGREIEIQLYIAGYTDSVGSRSDNQTLSERRARAIAAWFRKKGVSIPIYYQGFGEDVLEVPTPDETDEPRNRRALYVLSAGPPSASGSVPRSNWKLLRR